MSRLGTVLPALVIALTGGVAFAAADEAPQTAAETPTTTLTERRIDTAGPVDTVVAISIDGLNPKAITKLGPDGAPALHALMSEGASTLNARTEVELTDTLPNHTGMVTGRRIEARTGGHGVTWNDDRLRPRSVQAAAGHHVGSVFEVVHDGGGSTAYFASKSKFSLLQRSWPDAIDADTIVASNGPLVRNVLTDLTTRTRSFRLLHLSAPDVAGHARGFMGPAYLRAVASTDRQIAQVMETITSTPTLSGHTAVVLTSDHGGRGRTHRDPSRAVNFVVPFIVWGPDVTAGADLYALNAARTDPGRARTTYGDAPVRNGDVANLALDLLGLPAVPDSEHNADQGLEWSEVTARQPAATG